MAATTRRVPPWLDATPSTNSAMSTTAYAAPAAVHWMPPLVDSVTRASSGTVIWVDSPGITVKLVNAEVTVSWPVP